ncbi:ABC-2 type transporter [Xylanimonas cellulosilytica DSM 15894]|uniref:ABC-2 type transporter n=1 Tax=Xylanimonas cellulosilytica (strain DSM 15894 / JCM 12276 / CECT 5975 / KCTC 9989 / LMG 20990 / NBRC 107835 / XIL07) TaxID=446471 RepID=D1BT82_XYLCX|nr:ABC transporter permease [Xylanimonas cellulosilytica]ACZ30924.1 ABC-2 type transporter [Xylanimonas cellulosilytica DSM 15894]
MNLTYLRIDLTRQMRDVANLAFVIGLPVLMYLIFGSTFGDGGEMVRHGNVQFYVMTSMAVYGASVATTSISGMAAIELMQGWGRQLGLTPMRPTGYVATKVVVALGVSAAAVAAVFLAGLVTGAEATSAGVWLSTALIAWLGSALFALYGLAIAQSFRSESAVSIAAAGLVVFAFLGNLFVPMSGTMLQIARFLPMYGYASLARWPQLGGMTLGTDPSTPPGQDPLWALLLNVTMWAAIFAAIAAWAVRRGRLRQ